MGLLGYTESNTEDKVGKLLGCKDIQRVTLRTKLVSYGALSPITYQLCPQCYSLYIMGLLRYTESNTEDKVGK